MRTCVGIIVCGRSCKRATYRQLNQGVIRPAWNARETLRLARNGVVIALLSRAPVRDPRWQI